MNATSSSSKPSGSAGAVGAHRASSIRPLKSGGQQAPAACPSRERGISDFLDVRPAVHGAAGGGGGGIGGPCGLPPGAARLGADPQGRVFGTQLSPGSSELLPVRCPGTGWAVSFFQHMGDRKTQEDRFAVVPNLEFDGRTPVSFFGVFDGTVGDFASDNVKDLVVPKLLESPSWWALKSVPATHAGEQEKLLEQAMRDMYRNADDALLQLCSKSKEHYATSTSVTAVVLGEMIAIGHLGDSRVVLGKEVMTPGQSTPQLVGEQLTIDHKPDQENERSRIEKCGGTVERLPNHNNKPFIRGGDFTMRKAMGEQPMQLQYSRAFGAKDLKIFGLSNVPDVRIIRMGRDSYRGVRFLILASDGLWDVLSAQHAVVIAQQAVSQDLNPAECLVRQALQEQAKRKVRADNVTVICIQFDHPRRDRQPASPGQPQR
mmetsp:Transcript_80824/g.210531  ORF Transcript_80824/g.210531 Transcript_80824/m.210531 type:complete len:431 (+) Transcript_80824:48-1340(+)